MERFLVLTTVLVVVGCSPLETFDEALDRNRSCHTDCDCVLVYDSCACAHAVRRSFSSRAAELAKSEPCLSPRLGCLNTNQDIASCRYSESACFVGFAGDLPQSRCR
jgi:hypothetical protein